MKSYSIKHIIEALIIVPLIIFIVAGLAGKFESCATKLRVQPTIEDTLRFQVRELVNQIEELKRYRTNIARDTNTIKQNFSELQNRVISNNSDSFQIALLKELLKKPNPQPIEVNQAIIQGQLCCALLDNNRSQLAIADSIIKMQDSIILIQRTEIHITGANLSEATRENALLDHKNTQLHSKLRQWRNASLIETTAIAAALAFLKLTN